MSSSPSLFSRLSTQIGDLLSSLSDDKSLSPECQASMAELAEIYNTPLIKDKISSIFIPFIYRLRERIGRVRSACTDEEKRQAVKFFSTETFLRNASAAIVDECERALKESEAARRRGLTSRESGFPLISISTEAMERDIIPRVNDMLMAISQIASRYDPHLRRSFERYAVKIGEVIDLIASG
jgi:hypothetical protein